MNIVKKVLRSLISLFTYLFPVSNIILLESNADFSDNTYSLFKQLVVDGLHKKYRIVWLVKNLDSVHLLEAYSDVKYFLVDKSNLVKRLRTEIKLFVLYSRSKFVFFTHNIYSKSLPKKNQTMVFLTHGFHFKNGIGRYFDMNKITHVVSLSENDKDVAEKVYNVEREKLVTLGYSRNDLLFNSQNAGKMFIKNLYNLDNDSYIVWLPTYRRHENNLTNDSNLKESQSDLPLLNDIDAFESLNDTLSAIDTVMIIKPHPAQNLSYFNEKELSHIKVLSNQSMIHGEIQLYELLSGSSALVTDYSSVFIDYLLTDKPIIFTVDDVVAYEDKLGFMYENYMDYMPGDKVKTIEEMNVSLNLFREGIDDHRLQRKQIRDFFHEYQDSNASERIINEFKL